MCVCARARESVVCGLGEGGVDLRIALYARKGVTRGSKIEIAGNQGDIARQMPLRRSNALLDLPLSRGEVSPQPFA